MNVQLNHTIVWSRDKAKSAKYLADTLGLPPPDAYGPFLVVTLGNGVSLDYHDTEGDIATQHYAFLLDEAGFDEVFARIERNGQSYWADPAQTRKGKINHHDGGRGVYFEDPDGHLLEIITRPYGSGNA
jgi:catechol 2,3-dioxygenase-like lactoylglutathione lyase family enzyme